MGWLPAAAIPEYSIVEVPDIGRFEIHHKENSYPEPGKITWFDKRGTIELTVGAATRFEVISLP